MSSNEIRPNDDEPFIPIQDIITALDKFLLEVERLAAEDFVPRGWTGELAASIASTVRARGDKIEGFVTAFAPDASGQDYAETQHEDEHYHLGRPPFRGGFSDIAPPGDYASAEERYWAGFRFAIDNGYAERYQNEYLVEAALEAIQKGFFEKFFGELGNK